MLRSRRRLPCLKCSGGRYELQSIQRIKRNGTEDTFNMSPRAPRAADSRTPRSRKLEKSESRTAKNWQAGECGSNFELNHQVAGYKRNNVLRVACSQEDLQDDRNRKNESDQGDVAASGGPRN
jgi:hypothetical protein